MRLLPALAAAQMLGIGLADRGDWPSDAALAAGGVAALLGVVAVRSVRARTVSAIGVALALGAYSISTRIESARQYRPREPAELTVEAAVVRVAAGADWTRVDLVDAVDAASETPLGRIRVVAAPDSGLSNAVAGSRIRARLKLRAVRDTRNPGSRSRERDLERAGIAAVGRLVHPALWVGISDPDVSPPLSAKRREISARIARGGRGSELVRALGVGDRSGLDADTRDAFRGLGLSHLLAISGLHLALVGSLAFAVCRFGVSRSPQFSARFDARSAALVAALVAATGYASISGFGVPVRRALVALFGVALAVGRSRVGARAEPIAGAAVSVLALDPGALFDVGAQLSFVAATALAYSAPRRELASPMSRVARIRRALADAARASASATAATAPLAAWQFGSVASWAPIANLIMIPWTGALLLPGSLIAAATAASAWNTPTRVMCWLAAQTLDVVAVAARQVGAWSATPAPSIGWVLATGGLAIGAIRARGTGWRLALAFAVSFSLAVARPVGLRPGPPRIVALDVRQGAAAIVQSADAAVLIDGAGGYAARDWGERTVVPALRALGIARIDRIVVSHGDLDHRGGIPAVLEHFDVGAVWVPFGSLRATEFGAIVERARARRVPVVESGAGSLAQLGSGLTLTGLWPILERAGENRNERSLVVRVDFESVRSSAPRHPRSALFPGDIGAETERHLVATGVDLRADVLALAHHGSRTSSSAEFLAAVDASVAIASAPLDGRFAMPHPEVLTRAAEATSSVWWTGRDGAVMVGLASPMTVWGLREAATPWPAFSGRRGPP